MTTEKELHHPGIQVAIYRLAMSLDSLLVNGIQFGVLHTLSNGFVANLSAKLLNDLEALTQSVADAAAERQQQARETLTKLHTEFVALIDLMNGLSSFRSLALRDVYAAASRIANLRAESVQLIKELETRLETPKPYYTHRPKDAAAAVEAFVADLPRILEHEWTSAGSKTTVQA